MNKENLIELFRWYDENREYFNEISADYEDISIKAFRQLNFLNIPIVSGNEVEFCEHNYKRMNPYYDEKCTKCGMVRET